MTQLDTGYVRTAAAGAWTEVAYAGNAGTFINSLVAALPAGGGEIIIGPASAEYRFTGTLGSISKPCLIMCAPGAVFAPPTAGGGAVGGCLRFTSGGAGSIWKGGTFSELSGYALDQARILIDVQDGAHDVHLEDVAFNLVNTVATGQSCALVQVAGASSSSLLSGFQMARCRVRANSTREATSHSSGSILGWTAVRLQNALQAKVEGNTFWGGSTPNLSTGNLRCIYSALDSEFCSFRNNTGRGLLGLSDEQISGTDVIDAGASGLVEITNTSLEGHHSKFEGNNFEVCTAYSFYRQVGANYGSVMCNHFGRMSMVSAVVDLADSGVIGDGTAVLSNTFHNVSGPSQIRNAGYSIRVRGQQNVLLDGMHFTLVNKQGSYERYPIRIDNTCKNITIGALAMGFNTTTSNQFAPFSPIVWEGRAALEQTRVLFPSFFPAQPVLRN